jgi:hypothetical protein
VPRPSGVLRVSLRDVVASRGRLLTSLLARATAADVSVSAVTGPDDGGARGAPTLPADIADRVRGIDGVAESAAAVRVTDALVVDRDGRRVGGATTTANWRPRRPGRG